MNDFSEHCFLYQLIGNWLRDAGGNACQAKALLVAKGLQFQSLANIGDCGMTRWQDLASTMKAQYHKNDVLDNPNLDFNTVPLPHRDNSIDLVVNEQVIEHLHNTTFFISELKRIARVGGHLLLATENLNSIPNLMAMLLQRAPFSTQPLCGVFLGGWKKGIINPEFAIPKNHPAYSGTHGHVRVMTIGQLRQLLQWSGFLIRNQWTFGLRHFVLFHAQKISI